MQPTNHDSFMRRAIELARQAWGQTHPNPMVGAVIVEDGKIVAEGYHAQAGAPHAEVMALRALGRSPTTHSVLYVTLEPCCTHGRTPPCVDAIVAAGIRHVVLGAKDPNPQHSGKGVDFLRKRGVDVTEGVLGDDCVDLNLIFNHWIVHRQPFVAIKVASTMDSRLVNRDKEKPFITGELARADVQSWRKLFPAIAVSVNTLLADNPRLTARVPGQESCPRRFVLDRNFRSAGKAGLNLFQDAYRDCTVVVGLRSAAKASDLAWYEAEGVDVWLVDGPSENFLMNWIARCAQDSIYGIFIEAGPTLAAAVLAADLADYLFAYYAPKLSGDMNSPPWNEGEMPQLKSSHTKVIGQDVLFRGYLT